MKNRQDVEMVMQEALPPKERATVEFAYRIGSWRFVSDSAYADDDECAVCHGTGEIIGGLDCSICGGTGKPQRQAPGQKFFEDCMIFYSMDRRIYGFNANRSSEESKWKTTVFPRIQAARQLEQIPKYIEARVMTENWGLFFKDVYERMVALEAMFADFDHEIDRTKLPKILHRIPGFGTGRVSAN